MKNPPKHIIDSDICEKADLLDKEYEQFCHLKKNLGRTLRFRKCLYGANFSGKSWCETLEEFLSKELKVYWIKS